MDALGPVGCVLVVVEAARDPHRGLDRVHAGLLVPHMRRPAGHRDPRPHHAHLGGVERVHPWARFGNDRRIAARQRGEARERAVAGAFFLDDGVKLDGGGGLHPGELQRAEGHDVADEARLHVASAAAVDAALADRGFIGRRGPEIGSAFRHDVDMALQHQAAANDAARRVAGHDVVAARVVDQRWRPAWQRAERGGICWDAARLEADAAEQRRHRIQRAGFAPQRRLAGDQLPQRRDRIAPHRLTGFQDCAPRPGIERRHAASLRGHARLA